MSFVDRFVQDLLELVNHQATYRLVINKRLLIRVINWTTKIYDSTTGKNLEFREAIKVLYSWDNGELMNEWNADNSIDKLSYKDEETVERASFLKQSTLKSIHYRRIWVNST